MNSKGTFTISLDFELFWGVRDKRSLDSYGDTILNVRRVIPRLLDTFQKYNVEVTFATVGFLFAANKQELLKYSPSKKPDYEDGNLSPYEDVVIEQVGESERVDRYHYALDLIHAIKERKVHEISTHTFSHFYCLEIGQTKEDFESDIKAAISIGKKEGISIDSIVFPRNQYNEGYSDVLEKFGIKSYRGKEPIWFQDYQGDKETSILKKVLRTSDCYFNLSGHNCYGLQELADKGLPYNIPSSRFLRPFQNRISFLKPFQISRITRSMTYAAKNGLLYHLWWHPHNFGSNMEENFELLEAVLKHYQKLNTSFGFESKTMSRVAKELQTMASE